MRTEKGPLGCSHVLSPQDPWAWDCPQGPPRQLLPMGFSCSECLPGPAGVAQAGESRLRELAGSKRARHCLIFTHQCPVFRRRPVSCPTLSALWRPAFPKAWLQGSPQEVPADATPTPSELPTPPLHLFICHPTFLATGRANVLLTPCPSRSIVHRRPQSPGAPAGVLPPAGCHCRCWLSTNLL